MLAEDGADGLGDLGGGEDGEGDLVEERLEGVEVLAVDECDVDGEFGEAEGGVHAGEASAEDYDTLANRYTVCRSCHLLLLLLFISSVLSLF
jgi:hypothetical protein